MAIGLFFGCLVNPVVAQDYEYDEEVVERTLEGLLELNQPRIFRMYERKYGISEAASDACFIVAAYLAKKDDWIASCLADAATNVVRTFR